MCGPGPLISRKEFGLLVARFGLLFFFDRKFLVFFQPKNRLPLKGALMLLGGATRAATRAAESVGLKRSLDQKRNDLAENQKVIDAPSHKEVVLRKLLLEDQDLQNRAFIHFVLGEFEAALTIWSQIPFDVRWGHGFITIALFSAGRCEEALAYSDVLFDENGTLCLAPHLAVRSNGNKALWNMFCGSVPHWMPANLVCTLLFSFCYNAAVALPAKKSVLVLAMLQRAQQFVEQNPSREQRNWRNARVMYAIGALTNGERCVAAVSSDPVRRSFMQQAKRYCQLAIEASEDVKRSEIRSFLARVNVFLQHDQSSISAVVKTERALFERSDTPSNRVLLSHTGHSFKVHTFKRPTWDDFSGEFITGLVMQGYRCSKCKANVADKPGSLALARNSSCIGVRFISDDQHRRNGNFNKRRSLMLVWKKTGLAMVNKDVIRMIESQLDYLF